MKPMMSLLLTVRFPISDKERNCKACKAFIKPFEAPQKRIKIKIEDNFYFNIIFWDAWGGKG